MLIPKNTSNVIQCVTCGAENHKNISMQDCVKINNLFTKFVPDFTFQQIKDCENLFQKSLLSLSCAQCWKLTRAICDFRMRSLISSNKLRMRYVQGESERQTQSSAEENWLKIIDVISQSGRNIFLFSHHVPNAFPWMFSHHAS
ncbi:uncharacterized protein LOC113385596 [Ctenocephalides felis]|uniref:uncharacterized protein LOC113385596 n=1 Tax=Ctenocephalides felis TaxID=7515 RepID=UPI000E6E4A0C|nr:uncharacterized protein LOC113385596 [Ctenocephalides felis]